MRRWPLGHRPRVADSLCSSGRRSGSSCGPKNVTSLRKVTNAGSSGTFVVSFGGVSVFLSRWLLLACLLVLGPWSLVLGSWFLVLGSWFLVLGCWLVVGGWWLVVVGWWLVVGGWWLVVGGWWLVVGGCRLSVVGCRLSVVGCWLLVAGCLGHCIMCVYVHSTSRVHAETRACQKPCRDL